ncbi:MAG: aspartate ammonia-lyase [Parvibaculaceae bacterium]
MRTEHDALGSRSIDDRLYYGIQTSRALENFSISGKTISDIPHFVSSLIRIKQAAALANLDAGALGRDVATAIVEAGEHWLAHGDATQFCVDIYHGGGGTAANMNINEVLANRANEILTGHKGYDVVHPNTHVNMAQSTNDVIPSAMKLATHMQLGALDDAMILLTDALGRKEGEFSHVVKIARTCLQDALPITLGQEFSGYRSGCERLLDEARTIRRRCLHIPLGATAVGTGFGTRAGYRVNALAHLRRLSGLDITPESNLFDGLQNADQWIGAAAALKAIGLLLSKISNDLRLLSSGPKAGLGEIELPAVQPGSSIMPGKVNPVIPEMMMQVYFRILGNDATIARACEGELDLNVWESAIMNAISEAITLLSRSIPIFVEKCLNGIEANVAVCRAHAEASLALAAVIASLHDYPKAVAVARHAEKNGGSAKKAAVELDVLTEDQANEVFAAAVFTDIGEFHRICGSFPTTATARKA